MLNGQIVLVTGASRGIGNAIALTLGGAGATVIGTATSEEGADNISKIFSESDILGKGMKLNVTDNDQITSVLKAVTDEYGAVDVLINNAGITRDNILVRMKEEEWDDIINTNLSSVYRMSKAVLRGMIKKRSGRIISITSVVGAMGNAGQSNYAAAKAGIMGFTKSLAREVGARGITVNAVAPGFIDTDMTSSLADDHKAALLSQVPIKRLETPEEIADKLYDDPELHWVVLMVNNITDRYHQWPMNNRQFLAHIAARYDNVDATHHYEIYQSSGDTAIKIDIGISNVDTDGDTISDAVLVTNREYEESKQDTIRNIQLLDPQYLEQFVEEFESLVSDTED